MQAGVHHSAPELAGRTSFEQWWEGGLYENTYVVEDGKLLLRFRIHEEEPAPAPVAPGEAPPTDVTVPSPLPQLDESVTSEAEIIEPAVSEEETEEAPVVPATPPVSWSDGWAVGPARKR